MLHENYFYFSYFQDIKLCTPTSYFLNRLETSFLLSHSFGTLWLDALNIKELLMVKSFSSIIDRINKIIQMQLSNESKTFSCQSYFQNNSFDRCEKCKLVYEMQFYISDRKELHISKMSIYVMWSYPLYKIQLWRNFIFGYIHQRYFPDNCISIFIV